MVIKIIGWVVVNSVYGYLKLYQLSVKHIFPEMRRDFNKNIQRGVDELITPSLKVKFAKLLIE